MVEYTNGVKREILDSANIIVLNIHKLQARLSSSPLNFLPSDYFDMIIIDTPPIGSVIDAAVISTVCDGGILVIGAGDISYKFARKSKEQLEMTGCKLLGCVLNKVCLLYTSPSPRDCS